MIDKLIEKIDCLKNPSVIGLDTVLEYLPETVQKNCRSFEDVGAAIFDFNAAIIERISLMAPAVKVQIACYEQYGIPGLQAFKKTIELARSKGLVAIADIKRNDIGSTATCYSRAYLSGVEIGGKKHTAFESDFITLNGYLGTDGIVPFVADCMSNDRGVFILVKTSNPSSDELQNLKLSDGMMVYEAMGELVQKWGSDTVGKYGFSDVGAVVGATHKKEAEILRNFLPHTFFLVPGYGAQGGTADDLTVCFNNEGRGAIVNNSRGIICAYKKDKYKGLTFDVAAYNAAIEMQQDLFGALKRAGKAN